MVKFLNIFFDQTVCEYPLNLAAFFRSYGYNKKIEIFVWLQLEYAVESNLVQYIKFSSELLKYTSFGVYLKSFNKTHSKTNKLHVVSYP